ncbi:MAG: hypothetical protein H7Z72_15665 [Bacteroidetes bacterium]|nr:hypothetical protein [Fibrella sp.]
MQPICVLIMAGCLWACSSSDEKDPLLDEAARYHQQATEIQEVVEPKIEQIDSLKTVFIARRIPNTSAIIASLDSLKMDFAEWEGNVMEVPGMPHNHAHRTGGPDHSGHAHNRADATLKDLPADQMRDLQREMLNSIRQIQTRLDGVMTQAETKPPKTNDQSTSN